MKEQQPQQKHLNPIPISRSVNCLFIDHLSLFFMFLYVHLMKMRSNGQVVDDLNFRPVSLCSSLTMALFFQTRKFDSTSLGVLMGNISNILLQVTVQWTSIRSTCTNTPTLKMLYATKTTVTLSSDHVGLLISSVQQFLPLPTCIHPFSWCSGQTELLEYKQGAQLNSAIIKVKQSTFLTPKIALYTCIVSLGLFNRQFLVSLYCSKFLQQGLCCFRPFFLNFFSCCKRKH